jgi:hypothetical protein
MAAATASAPQPPTTAPAIPATPPPTRAPAPPVTAAAPLLLIGPRSTAAPLATAAAPQPPTTAPAIPATLATPPPTRAPAPRATAAAPQPPTAQTTAIDEPAPRYGPHAAALGLWILCGCWQSHDARLPSKLLCHAADRNAIITELNRWTIGKLRVCSRSNRGRTGSTGVQGAAQSTPIWCCHLAIADEGLDKWPAMPMKVVPALLSQQPD